MDNDKENAFEYLLGVVRYQYEEGYLYVDNEEAEEINSLLKEYISDYEGE